MNLLASLDARDRKLLLWFIGVALALAVLSGFLLPNGNSNDNPLPSTYLSGQHGARAAYETLLRSGYPIERWESPLSDLADNAGPETVVILAEPFTRDADDMRAVRRILERGGRVLSTGILGSMLLPSGQGQAPSRIEFASCKLEPAGLDALSFTGEVWMTPSAGWKMGNPAHRLQYACGGSPAVVEFDWGKGHAVWWASSTPLENGSISRAQNLELLLNSLGPRAGHRFYWDESLHGELRSTWSYASGPALTLLWSGLLALTVLIVFSFSRRAGPLRELPAPVRATPIEYLEALGSLYRNAGASTTALSVAMERFRRHALRLCGQRPAKMDAASLAAIVRRRFPKADAALKADLAACEEAMSDDALKPRHALKLVQTLHHHHDALLAAARPGRLAAQSDRTHPNPQERAL